MDPLSAVVAAATVLKQDADLGLELVADLLIHPIFPEEYIAKEKTRTLAEIASAKDRPQVVAGWAFNELIYGTHPLHRPTHGYPETVEGITREDLIDFTSSSLCPTTRFLSIVGDFRVPEILSLIERRFGGWRSRPVSILPSTNLCRQTGTAGEVHHDGGAAINIYLGHLGVERAPIRISTRCRFSTRFWAAAQDSPREFRSGCGTKWAWPTRRLRASR